MFDSLLPIDSVADVCHPRLQALYAYWAERCGDRFAPARADLDPADLGPLLPYVALIEPMPESNDWRLRLIGSHILEGYALQPVPRQLSELAVSPARDLMKRQYERTLAERRPLRYGPAFSLIPGRDHVVTEHIDLPLSTDGQTVSMILAGVAIRSPREWDEEVGRGATVRPRCAGLTRPPSRSPA